MDRSQKLCMAKFMVLFSLAAVQVLMSVGMYYLSAAIVTGTQDYNFILSPLFVIKEAGLHGTKSIMALIVVKILFFILIISFQPFRNKNRQSIDSWMQSFSKHALTKGKNLQGEKNEGNDAYTGNRSRSSKSSSNGSPLLP